jgi:hypothetical protein
VSTPLTWMTSQAPFEMRRFKSDTTSVADVMTLGNNELLVVGVAAGHTTLLVWRGGAATPERFQITISGPGSVAAPAPPLFPRNARSTSARRPSPR